MLLLDFARTRVRLVLRDIEHLKECDFPFPDAVTALQRIEDIFREFRRILDILTPDYPREYIVRECYWSLQTTATYLPILGFILRSTDVRTAFETWGPIRRLAESILRYADPNRPQPDKIHLILSSEWDYSPFVYSRLYGHEEWQPHCFIMIGLPATESPNPLLLPLTGHELGHVVWRCFKADMDLLMDQTVVQVVLEDPGRYGCIVDTRGKTAEQVYDELLHREALALARYCTRSQAEETYCDFVGLRVFGRGYLNAFAYLLSASTVTSDLEHPGLPDRVDNLVLAAQLYQVKCPPDYALLFAGPEVSCAETIEAPDEWGFSAEQQLQMEIARKALQRVAKTLAEKVRDVINGANVPHPSEDEARRIHICYKYGVPAEGCRSLADILGAAWLAYEDDKLWHDRPEVSTRKDEVISSLVLKNIEVFEIEQKMRDPE